MKTLVKPFLAGFMTTALVLTASGARAQEAPARSPVSGSIAGGVATVPDYEGADDQRIIPLVAGDVHWGERYVAVEGTSLRVNLLNSKNIEFGPVANLTFGRDARVKSMAVRSLGVIDDAYEVGAFGAIKTGSLLTPGDELKLRVQGVRDVSDVHDGWVVEGAIAYRLPVGSRMSVTADASLHYADDDYARTYFSATPVGSVSSGLTAFDAKGGIKDVGASLTTAYALTDRFSLIGYGGYRRLVGDFADSPVVSRAGSADQFSAGVGIGFRF